MRRTLILMLGLTLLVAACGGGDGDDPGTTTGPGDATTTTTGGDAGTPPAVDGEVVLTISYEGGFVPVEMAYHPMPMYALLSDGRLLSPGVITLEFPGRLLPAVQVVQLDDAAVGGIMDSVEALGLQNIDDERIEEPVNVADVGDTVARLFDDGGEHRLAVFALDMVENSADHRVQGLKDLVATIDAASIHGEALGEYEPERVEVVVSPSLDGQQEPGAEVKPWPLQAAAADLKDIGGATGLLCASLEGEEAAEAWAVFQDSTQLTFFDDGTDVWRLTPRPLFPGETGCP